MPSRHNRGDPGQTTQAIGDIFDDNSRKRHGGRARRPFVREGIARVRYDAGCDVVVIAANERDLAGMARH
jgi:hypothetical protein